MLQNVTTTGADRIAEFPYGEGEFDGYRLDLIHRWLKVLSLLGIILVPLFFVLDSFMMPRELLPLFGIYRGASTAVVLVLFIIIRRTRAGLLSYIHGYLVTISVGGAIALMTVDLGGFNSSYYAGLNLVIIGVNLLLPWKSLHSALNAFVVVLLYVLLNLLVPHPFDPVILLNNMFFLCATGVVAVSINTVQHKRIRKEFDLLVQLKKARDSLWSEMELAKRIQTALLPARKQLKGFDIAASMAPAKEVGGDYYDIIETAAGQRWIAIGDVSGHGVDSGLIMMMAQTGVLHMVNNGGDCKPSDVLRSVNTVLRENLSRLRSDYYMTMMVLKLESNRMMLSGHHQDVLIYRSSLSRTEILPSKGTWLGIIDDLGQQLTDRTASIGLNDVIVLFSDGITEATGRGGELYGERRLEKALNRSAHLPAEAIVEAILEEVKGFQVEQSDDMTLVVIKRKTLADGEG